MPPVQENTWLTGRYMVIREPAFRNIINDTELAENIIKAGKAFIDPQTFEALMTHGGQDDD